jgi:hypothetical protein
VVHEPDNLFSSQLERVELVEQTKSGGNNTASTYASHSTTHACKTLSSTRTFLPWLQMVDLSNENNTIFKKPNNMIDEDDDVSNLIG